MGEYYSSYEGRDPGSLDYLDLLGPRVHTGML